MTILPEAGVRLGSERWALFVRVVDSVDTWTFRWPWLHEQDALEFGEWEAFITMVVRRVEARTALYPVRAASSSRGRGDL